MFARLLAPKAESKLFLLWVSSTGKHFPILHLPVRPVHSTHFSFATY